MPPRVESRREVARPRSGVDRVQLPLTWDSLEDGGAAFVETDFGASDEVLDRSGDEDFLRPRLGGDA